MGEVDHAYDAVNHRITDGNEPVNRTQREAVNELLEKILQIAPLYVTRSSSSVPGFYRPRLNLALEKQNYKYKCDNHKRTELLLRRNRR